MWQSLLVCSAFPEPLLSVYFFSAYYLAKELHPSLWSISSYILVLESYPIDKKDVRLS